MNSFSSIDEVLKFFEEFGGTDVEYLSHHFPRFRATVDELQTGWSAGIGSRVLDVGAHWLHQASLLWGEGYHVTAADLPTTLELNSVKAAAARMSMDLIPIADLSKPAELRALAADSFDLVIFSEIIEHITFNPVEFWREIYRVLRPGGRIVITTPNYYSPYSRVWNFTRFMQGFGGGISVDEILTQHTYSHHWKEFSVRELIYYFARLSPDFNTVKAKHFRSFEASPPRASLLARLAYRVKRKDPVQHANIYMEVEIKSKKEGIAIRPSW